VSTVIIAQAQSAPPPAPSPVAFSWFDHGRCFSDHSPRKGKNPFLWFSLGFIPLVGFFLAFILASRPDKGMLDRIRRLEEQVSGGTATTTRVEPPPI